jgi:hypothetical protein
VSTGTICLTCRCYINMADEQYRCRCEKPVPSEDGRTPNEQIRRQHPLATRCRSCSALIVWFKTAAGKRMPVDESSTQPTDAEHQLDLKRHVSHFSTCPDAAKFRGPR